MIWLPDAAINCPVDALAGDGRRRALSQRIPAVSSIFDRVGPRVGSWTVPPAQGGTTYFVSPTGSDAWPGTEAQPFRTVQVAFNTLAAGDRVILKDGEYASEQLDYRKHGTATNRITVTCESLHGAKIAVDNSTGQDKAGIRAGDYAGGDVPAVPYWALFDGFEIDGGPTHCLQLTGASDSILRNLYLHDSGTQEGIKMNLNADRNLVEYCHIARTGMRARPVGWPTIALVQGEDQPNADGVDITTCDDVTVRHTFFDDCGQYAGYAKKLAHRCAFVNNLARGCTYGFAIGESTVAYDSLIANNILIDILTGALDAYGSRNSFILHNTVFRGARWHFGLLRFSSANTWVNIPDDAYTKGNYALSVLNNVLVQDTPVSLLGDPRTIDLGNPGFQGTSFASDLASYSLDHNLYFNKQGGYEFRANGNTRGSDLAAWRAATSANGYPKDVNSLLTDPLFLSESELDAGFLHLSDVSPAKNAGAALPVMSAEFAGMLATDFFGRTRSVTSPSMGAIE